MDRVPVICQAPGQVKETDRVPKFMVLGPFLIIPDTSQLPNTHGLFCTFIHSDIYLGTYCLLALARHILSPSPSYILLILEIQKGGGKREKHQ